jgi:hypothetical protein
LYEVEDKSWGMPNALGEWNGIIRDLIDEKADLAMAPSWLFFYNLNIFCFVFFL